QDACLIKDRDALLTFYDFPAEPPAISGGARWIAANVVKLPELLSRVRRVGTEVIQNTMTNLNRPTADDCEMATNHVCFALAPRRFHLVAGHGSRRVHIGERVLRFSVSR